jgi:hypothetical protein
MPTDAAPFHQGLTLANTSLIDGRAALFGGGVFCEGCQRLLLQNSSLSGCVARGGGGVAVVGPTGDDIAATVTAVTGRAADVVPYEQLYGSAILDRVFLDSNRAEQGAGPYVRYSWQGAGLLVLGNATVLVAGSRFAASNSARVGSAVASLQRCAAPPSEAVVKQALAASAAGEVRLQVQGPLASNCRSLAGDMYCSARARRCPRAFPAKTPFPATPAEEGC